MLDIVLGAEGIAVKWRDKISILVTDMAGRSKEGWNLDFGFYLKNNRKRLKGFGLARKCIDFILDPLL